MLKQKVYFPNLNGLRFIAAMMVLFPHIEQIKSSKSLDDLLQYYPYATATLGVVMFFVLSGFLITYLLLAEERNCKTISVGKFYLRRILRIWPLYFLIIGMAFFVLPYIGIFTWTGNGTDIVQSDLIPKLLLFMFFMPNLVVVSLGIIPYASHTWSIGTEEQFYVLWPIILKYTKRFRILLMLFIVLVYTAIDLFLLSEYSSFVPSRQVFTWFWATFKIDCMAIGGIFAIILFQKNKLLSLLQNRYLFYFALLTVAGMWIKGIRLEYFHFGTYAILFGLIILNFASNDKFKNTLENKYLNYLGNISYGLYMYHPIGIALAIAIGVAAGCITNWLLYPLSVALTIAIAGLSYRYFESYFLKFKDRFSNIESGRKLT